MPRPISSQGLHWRKTTGLEPVLADHFEERLATILEKWRGTPYMAGQQCLGAGVDCVRFVAAVLDELYHRAPVPIATLPPDAALHSREGAIAGMKRIRELYMPNDAIEDGSIEPGDVLVTGPRNGGPGHAMIVGPRPSELWHAAGDAVHMSGLGFAGETKVFRVYRMRDRSVAAC